VSAIARTHVAICVMKERQNEKERRRSLHSGRTKNYPRALSRLSAMGRIRADVSLIAAAGVGAPFKNRGGSELQHVANRGTARRSPNDRRCSVPAAFGRRRLSERGDGLEAAAAAHRATRTFHASSS